MNTKNNKNLILSLIKDDLTNTKLVLGLNALGLQASEYALNLNETIFNCVGIAQGDQSNKVYERYSEMTKRIKYIDMEQNPKQVSALVQEIYTYLRSVKTSV